MIGNIKFWAGQFKEEAVSPLPPRADIDFLRIRLGQQGSGWGVGGGRRGWGWDNL